MAAARAAIGAVVVIVVTALVLAMLAGPQGAWPLAELVAVAVIIIGAGMAAAAARPRKGDAMSGGPGLACPGCGSPDVDLRLGLLCGTCAETAVTEGGGNDG